MASNTGRRSLGWTSLVLALLVGIAIGAGGVLLLTPTEETVSPRYATQTATGCTAGDLRSGWVGQLAQDDRRHVLLNLSIGHDSAGLDLTYALEETSAGVYRFAIDSTPSTEKGEPPSDCQPRTTLQATISLPSDFDSIVIALDGERVTAVRNTGESFPDFRTLPPVSAD